MKRVVITGLGIIAPNGIGSEQFWSNCLEQHCAAEKIPSYWKEFGDYTSNIWAPLPQFDFTSLGISKTDLLQLDKNSILALIAANEAFQSAGLKPTLIDEKYKISKLEEVDSQKCGVFAGTGAGGITSLIEAHSSHVLYKSRERVRKIAEEVQSNDVRKALVNTLRFMDSSPRLNPYTASMMMPNAVANILGIRYSIRGPNKSICTACSSGATAIGMAFESIQSGTIDLALSGGCDYLADDYGGVFKAFDSTGTLSRASKPSEYVSPFDKNRSGFLFSEGGAGLLVLEELEHALKRNAPIIAEIKDFSESFEAYNMMSMDPGGKTIETILKNLLKNTRPQDIDYINTHGTGTVINDEVESAKIQEIFGNTVLLNSTKGLTGHTLGASGAIEAAVCALSIRDQMLHGSPGLTTPIRDVSMVKNTQPSEIDKCINLSFAFGGNLCGMLIEKFKG
ncbi:beta-ketoacyl-[acyl-carrier-protein] synthase family protein [Chitinispirillales bacterium ANBcel5]|uniref:beta-ketoacyl-[acyl-carrier-protein] synthase family protein n=1 Tax=Cellulosispirillum alkaliphilum TaxID=3039283 RepID=UPI002A58B49D|nr:beta-ketoacyl-[acyl-carrier-protein] synthase family protein [Chitinispirillales bacterium ANBcel5]